MWNSFLEGYFRIPRIERLGNKLSWQQSSTDTSYWGDSKGIKRGRTLGSAVNKVLCSISRKAVLISAWRRVDSVGTTKHAVLTVGVILSQSEEYFSTSLGDRKIHTPYRMKTLLLEKPSCFWELGVLFCNFNNFQNVISHDNFFLFGSQKTSYNYLKRNIEPSF